MRGGHASPKQRPSKDWYEGDSFSLMQDETLAADLWQDEVRERAKPRLVRESTLDEFLQAFGITEDDSEDGSWTLCPSWTDAVLQPLVAYASVLEGHEQLRARRQRLLVELAAAGPGKPW